MIRLLPSPAFILLLAAAPLAAESIEGLWLSDGRSPAGVGLALEFSGDGRMRLSQGVAIGEQWILQEKKKSRYTLQILDPSTGQTVRSVQLEVGEGKDRILIETDLASGVKTKMAFVSRGDQKEDPPFLGRWQLTLPKFGLLGAYEFTEDGWVWLRAPFSSEVGRYQLDGDRVLPQWEGEYSPVGQVKIVGQALIVAMPNGFTERFLRPRFLEATTPRPADPRQ